MISSLFSMFDPVSSPLIVGVGNWLYLLVPLVGMLWGVFSLPLGFNSMVIKLAILTKETANQYSSGSASYVTIFLLVMFLTVLMWNEVGLIPFGFGVSSHLVTNLSLGLTLVMCGLVAVVCTRGIESVVAHIVPYGAPIGLSFALAVIETVSFIIRPFTLSIRLTGNMITGHLLVALLHELISSLLIDVLPIGIVILFLGVGLLTFELAVGVVQATIFTVLVLMYWSEE